MALSVRYSSMARVAESCVVQIWNAVFTCCIVALIGTLQQGVLSIVMLLSFTALWIAACTVRFARCCC